MISFRFKAGAAPVPRYNCTQFYNVSKITYAPRSAHAQLRRSSAAAVSKRRAFHRHYGPYPSRSSALDAVRHKTKLPASSQRASFWSMRGYPFWHRRGCTWVHSEGDPRRAQRDKDCPACQEHVKMPVELSQRELMWQRQLQFMREWIDRDPYDAMFGWSNDLLKGSPRRDFWNKRLLRRFRFDDIIKNEQLDKDAGFNEHTWRKGLFRGQESTDASENSPTSAEITAKPTPVESKQASQEKPEATPRSEGYTIRGWGRWKVSSTDTSGRVTERSGNMTYDPISMRMIPSQNFTKATNLTKEAPKAVVGSNEEEHIPVQKSQVPPETETISKANINRDADHQVSAQEASSTPNMEPTAAEFSSEKAIPLQSPPLGITLSERRLNLIRRAEQAMTLAQSQLEALSTKLDRTQRRPATAVELDDTIKRLQRAKYAFKNLHRNGPTKEKTNQTPVVMNAGEKVATPAEKPHQKDASPVKEALENSWLKENSNKQQSEKPVQILSSAESSRDSKAESKAMPQAESAEDMASIAQKRNNPLLKRDKSLKHMTAAEIGYHRAALLKSWAKKHKKSHEITPAERKLNEEIKAQKDAMSAYENRPKINTLRTSESSKTASKEHSFSAEGDLSPNAIQFANNERWYKKKAPHAFLKDQERMHDKALVAEIRDIYEEAYGLIDVNHRQGNATQLEKPLKVEDKATPKPSNEPPTQHTKRMAESPDPPSPSPSQHTSKPPPSQSAIYQILAYDRKTSSVHTASASASYSPPTGSGVLSFTDALERLQHPAKFLPFISQLHSDGYEIVSASKNLLVFKKLSPGSLIDKLAIKELRSVTKESTKANRIEAEARLNTLINEYAGVNSASNIRHSARNSDRPKPSSIPSHNNPRVRKEEPVFTGRSTKEPSSLNEPSGSGKTNGRRHRRSASTRLFLVTGKLAVAAACVYLLGCVIEELSSFKSESQEATSTTVSETASGLVRPQSSVSGDRKVDSNTTSDQSVKSGFWAAVNKEQARRAESRQAEALRRQAEEKHRALNSSNMSLAASQAAVAAFDVALFSTALWVVMKILDRRS